MDTIRLADTTKVDDQVFNELVNKVTNMLKLEVLQELQVRSQPAIFKMKKGTSKVGTAVAERIEKMPADRQKVFNTRLKTTNLISPDLQNFAVLRGVDLRATKLATTQINLKSDFSFINSTFNEAYYKKFAEKYMGIQLIGNGGGATVNKNLKFKVHTVKCVDETNPEWPGSDEIAMGGIALSDTKQESMINEIFVGGNFDDGDVKTYNPAKVLKQFPFTSTGTFPKSYAVFLALSEKDGGGFATFIKKLYDAIKDKLQAVFTAVGGAIGAAVGGAIGGAVGGPLGILAGAAIGFILGALVEWIVGLIQDDTFAPQVAIAEFGSINATFNGSMNSPIQTLNYVDHGGHYQVRYNWEISN
ncbi:hypothetical protein GCM10028807_56570 [Spirosoma daeguense]